MRPFPPFEVGTAHAEKPGMRSPGLYVGNQPPPRLSAPANLLFVSAKPVQPRAIAHHIMSAHRREIGRRRPGGPDKKSPAEGGAQVMLLSLTYRLGRFWFCGAGAAGCGLPWPLGWLCVGWFCIG